MTIRLRLIIFLSFILFLWSCVDDSQDMEAPNIEFLETVPAMQSAIICGEPDDRVFLLKDDTELRVDIRVSDNEEIAELKWDIHNNFDCHGHGGGSAPGFTPPAVDQQTEDWSLLEITTINAATYQIDEVLRAPENVTAGNYHFGLQAVDQSGNTTPFGDVFTIRVWNPNDTIAPNLELDAPTQRNLEASKTDVLTFSGTLQDDQPLGDGGNAIVFLTYRKVNSSNAFTGPFSVVPAGQNSSYAFNIEFEVPSTLTTGDYILSLHGHDGVRNQAAVTAFDLTVVN